MADTDGDAVETAAQAIHPNHTVRPVSCSCLDEARDVIQALVDGGHYVPLSERDETVGDLVRELAIMEGQRDAAITRAEALTAMNTYLKTQTEQVQLALAEAVELLRRWRNPADTVPEAAHLRLVRDTDALLVRQDLVTREAEGQ